MSQDLGMEGTKKPREIVLITGTCVCLEPLKPVLPFPSQLWRWIRSKKQETNGALLLIRHGNGALRVQPPRTVWNSSHSRCQPCHSRGSRSLVSSPAGREQTGMHPQGQAEVEERKGGSWARSGLLPHAPCTLDTTPPRRRGECWGVGSAREATRVNCKF